MRSLTSKPCCRRSARRCPSDAGRSPVQPDLFTYDLRSIAWLRVVRLETGVGRVAVVVEPDDNPGVSSVNAAESLLRDLRRAFPGLEPISVFVHFPHDPRGPGWTELCESMRRSCLSDGPSTPCARSSVSEWSTMARSTRPHARSSVASDTHCSACSLLRVDPPPDPLRDLSVYGGRPTCRGRTIPPVATGVSGLSKSRLVYPSGGHPDPAVGAHWFLTLTDDDLPACWYHRAEWHRIAEVSVDVFRSLVRARCSSIRSCAAPRAGALRTASIVRARLEPAAPPFAWWMSATITLASRVQVTHGDVQRAISPRFGPSGPVRRRVSQARGATSTVPTPALARSLIDGLPPGDERAASGSRLPEHQNDGRRRRRQPTPVARRYPSTKGWPRRSFVANPITRVGGCVNRNAVVRRGGGRVGAAVRNWQRGHHRRCEPVASRLEWNPGLSEEPN